MVRFLFAKDPSDCHVEKGWEKGAERETRQEAVLVTLARGCGGRNWKGDSEEGHVNGAERHLGACLAMEGGARS